MTTALATRGLSGADAGNYQISGLAAPLTAAITKANLAVAGLTAQNKVYDASANATLLGSAALSGILGSDSVSISGGTPTTGTFSD